MGSSLYLYCTARVGGALGYATDNTAALMALVHGKSDSLSLDVMAKFAHMVCFALHTAPYFEYVESAAE